MGFYLIVLQVSFRFIQKYMKRHISNAQAVSFVERAAKLQFVLLTLSFAALTATFIASDFSVKLAASHSHSMKPFLYKISGVWGNHEGSILLWTLMLSLYGALIPIFGKHLPPVMKAYAIGIPRDTSAYALYGLCRIFCCVLFFHRCAY